MQLEDDAHMEEALSQSNRPREYRRHRRGPGRGGPGETVLVAGHGGEKHAHWLEKYGVWYVLSP